MIVHLVMKREITRGIISIDCTFGKRCTMNEPFLKRLESGSRLEADAAKTYCSGWYITSLDTNNPHI